ncbi:hypothetical protein ACFDB1_11175 [Enterococcus lactis]
MDCKVRFIPSFVNRYNRWDSNIVLSNHCPFCGKWTEALPVPNSSFRLIKNDYPFMSNQYTVFGKKHQQFLSGEEIASAVELVHRMSDCESGSLQILGSGASIPHHAHFSISNEKYPINDLKREVIFDSEMYRISRILGSPHLVVVISGKVTHISKLTEQILKHFRYQNLSYNILLTKKKEIFIIPRTQENSITLQRKVGVSLVGGIYPCYTPIKSRFINSDELLKEMFKHWERVSELDLLSALQETTISSEITNIRVMSLLGINTKMMIKKDTSN